ncbi:MAG: hypothetical protein ACP5O0_09690 [Acidimicrobiales bacterium]
MPEGIRRTGEYVDPTTGILAEVRFVQPFQATKSYLCPHCSSEIPERTGHYVVVPIDAVDLRRHWHRYCWERPGPSRSRTRQRRR